MMARSRMPPDVPDLHDDVVALRPPTEGDLDAIVSGCQDPQISRFTRVPSPYTHEHAELFLARSQAAWADAEQAGELPLLITDAATGRLLGAIGLKQLRDRGASEVGYWLAVEARGHGYASRAVTLVARWALGDLGYQRLELFTDPVNEPSQAVATRCGFTREGVLRSYFEHPSGRTDVVMFSLLPGDL